MADHILNGVFMKLFDVAKVVNVKVFEDIISDMEQNLDFLNDTNNKEEVRELCISYIKGQRNDIEGLKKGSWCVAPNIDGMKGEERADFVYRPTYIAISVLTLIAKKYPDIPDSVENFWEVLKNGYDFASGRNFKGHGYEAESGLRETMKIFKKGGVIDFIKSNPDFSKKFYDLINV